MTTGDGNGNPDGHQQQTQSKAAHGDIIVVKLSTARKKRASLKSGHEHAME
jgi:hypothetical protein